MKINRRCFFPALLALLFARAYDRVWVRGRRLTSTTHFHIQPGTIIKLPPDDRPQAIAPVWREWKLAEPWPF